MVVVIILCGPGVSPAATQQRDSAGVLRAAKAAQQKFERTRRSYLPTDDSDSPDHCDERVGQWCFTYGDPEDAWEPPKEDRHVTEARDSLVALLKRSARAQPGDRWIAGQLVRYLVEDGQTSEARDAARDCVAAESWWCAALEGYAYHAAEDFVSAEKAFDRALAMMDQEQRCDWQDISVLIPGAPPREYRDLGCATRGQMEQKFWWMSDPLYLIPGNERRSEHFARQVYVLMESDASSITPNSWRDELAPWVIRYGIPAGWERRESRSLMVQTDPEIATQYRGPTQVFEPSWTALASPATLGPDSLRLRYKNARTGYVPSYTERFDTLRYQVATFHRPPVAIVVGAFDMTSDSVPQATATLAGLFLEPNDHEPPRVNRLEGGASGVIALDVPPRAGVVSLEAVTLNGKRAGRARYWLALAPLPGGIALSDVLLLARPDSLPRALPAASGLARKGVTVPRGGTLGLYWEVYGAAGGSPIALSVTLLKEPGGWLSRAARSMGLGSKERAAVRIQWADVPPPDGAIMPESIALDLGKNNPGRYTIRVEASGPGGTTASAERVIYISES